MQGPVPAGQTNAPAGAGFCAPSARSVDMPYMGKNRIFLERKTEKVTGLLVNFQMGLYNKYRKTRTMYNCRNIHSEWIMRRGMVYEKRKQT
jgi:hypothetical protein